MQTAWMVGGLRDESLYMSRVVNRNIQTGTRERKRGNAGHSELFRHERDTLAAPNI